MLSFLKKLNILKHENLHQICECLCDVFGPVLSSVLKYVPVLIAHNQADLMAWLVECWTANQDVESSIPTLGSMYFSHFGFCHVVMLLY